MGVLWEACVTSERACISHKPGSFPSLDLAQLLNYICSQLIGDCHAELYLQPAY